MQRSQRVPAHGSEPFDLTMLLFPLRDENPTRTVPWLTYGLLVLNVAAFLASEGAIAGGQFWITHWYGLVPARLIADPTGEFFTVLTSMFLHGGWIHLGSNMWFLYIFADNIEDGLGRTRFLIFYLICGLAAAASQVIIDVHNTVPMVGASGAIAGVLGGYLVLYPRAPIVSLNMVPLLWLFTGVVTVVPAWVIGLMFFFSDVLTAYTIMGNVGNAGVAVFAHLGGFATGFALTRWHPDFSRRLRRAPPPSRGAWVIRQ